MRPPIRFPEGRQLALTWSIPESFGGLTAAMLQRSRAFRALGGVDVGIWTLDPLEDRATRDRTLAERDALADGVTVGSAYDWLREHPLPGGSLRRGREAFAPLGEDEGVADLDSGDGTLRRRVLRDAGGTLLQIDHLRADGTLALSDRRDARERGRVGGRSLVLCDASGAPVRSWTSPRHLYAAWLDRLTAKEPTFLVVDSKAVARFALDYRRRHVTTVHVVHGSHRSDEDPDVIRASREEVFERLDGFDAVVFPTAGQRRDVRALVGRGPNLQSVPNALPPVVGDPAGPRGGVAFVGRLDPLKQVDHAIRAVQLANARGGASLELDVYGTGPEEQRLRALAAGDERIRFRGFATDVQERLSMASTLLLTSSSEAFGLTIGEAMTAGCLPIAYDVRYGPSDLVDHGRTGWLVAPDDVDGLADALLAVSTFPPEHLERMRARAQRAAEGFGEHAVTERWARVLRRARRRTTVRGRVGRVVARLRGGRRG